MRRLLAMALLAAASCYAATPVEQQVADAVKDQRPTVVHLWAPWCSNCLSELKSGGWLKMVNENPDTRFVFVSVWNDGDNGRAALEKFGLADRPNVTILADAGPRRGENKLKRMNDLPVSWIPTTWIYKGGDLRYALNYGEIRFDMLKQMLADTTAEW